MTGKRKRPLTRAQHAAWVEAATAKTRRCPGQVGGKACALTADHPGRCSANPKAKR